MISSLFLLREVFWFGSNQLLISFDIIKFSVNKELKLVFSSFSKSRLPLVTLRIFFFIIFINYMGLWPYVFTPSRQLRLTALLAVPLWIGHITYTTFLKPFNFLAHLVPLGTPNGLIPFIVLIELVSSSIRPITLSVRLSANIIAGHLLLILLGRYGRINLFFVRSLVILTAILFLILESGVAIIQAYVFAVLSSLYLEETNSSIL